MTRRTQQRTALNSNRKAQQLSPLNKRADNLSNLSVSLMRVRQSLEPNIRVNHLVLDDKLEDQ